LPLFLERLIFHYEVVVGGGVVAAEVGVAVEAVAVVEIAVVAAAEAAVVAVAEAAVVAAAVEADAMIQLSRKC